MKILLTGASGFLGSWLTRELSLKNEVVAVVRPDSNVWRIRDIPGVLILESDSGITKSHLIKYRADILVVGDWWGVSNKFRNHDRQLENLERFRKTISVALEFGVPRIIGVGSQAELGSVSGIISDEQESNPTTKYGEAKALSHQFLSEQCRDSEAKYVWGRVFSTYGALDNSEWMIPSLYEKLSSDRTFQMTAGTQIWSYLHAFDFATAIAYLVANPSVSGAVNIGNPETMAIKDFATIAAGVLQKISLLEFGSIPFRKDEVMELRPVSGKLKGIGWAPAIDFQIGIRHTFDWLAGAAVRDFRGSLLPELKMIKA